MKSYRCWIVSDRGLTRPLNEDACAASTSGPDHRLAQWEGFVDKETGWVILADGIGGHSAGEVASYLAISCLSALAEHLSSAGGVRMALNATHQALLDAMAEDETLVGMGTTIAGLSFGEGRVLAFNVGDSRIYRKHATLEQVSVDHVVDGHVLTQCLGGLYRDRPPSPHIASFDVRDGEILLLCSDGLTDMIADTDIDRILSSSTENPAQRLVSAALAAGGLDNVTVAVIRISEVPQERQSV